MKKERALSMKKEHVLYTVACIALVFLILFDIAFLWRVTVMKEQPRRATGGVTLDPNAQDERPGEEQGTVSGVTVAGFSSLTIPPELDTIAIDLYNPIENSGLYYMTFEFRLPDDSEQGYEVLFKTGFVAPGKHIYQVTLAHGLPAGEYTAQMLIQPYRMYDISPTNNVSAIVALTVK